MLVVAKPSTSVGVFCRCCIQRRNRNHISKGSGRGKHGRRKGHEGTHRQPKARGAIRPLHRQRREARARQNEAKPKQPSRRAAQTGQSAAFAGRTKATCSDLRAARRERAGAEHKRFCGGRGQGFCFGCGLCGRCSRRLNKSQRCRRLRREPTRRMRQASLDKGRGPKSRRRRSAMPRQPKQSRTNPPMPSLAHRILRKRSGAAQTTAHSDELARRRCDFGLNAAPQIGGRQGGGNGGRGLLQFLAHACHGLHVVAAVCTNNKVCV